MRTHDRNSIAKEIRSFRRSLSTLDECLRHLGPMLSATATLNAAPKGNGARRRPRFSAKARASLVLQGRYMGFVRQLKPRQKAQVRKIKETQGVRVAIQKAAKLLRKEAAA